MDEKNIERIQWIFEFLHLIGKLKTTYRFGANENLQGDSSADHSWRLAVMVFLLASELKLDVDVEKSMKIALVHDLAEALTGDIDARDIKNQKVTKAEKQEREMAAMEKICGTLPAERGEEIYNLWEEYQQKETKEAKFINALDKIETLTHVVEIGYENYDDVDLAGVYGNKAVERYPELMEVMRVVKEELKAEYEKGGFPWKEEYDINDIREKVDALA